VAKIAILGANGKLGQELVSRALDVGHRVNAWVRDLTKFKRQNESLTVYGGADPDALDAAIEGCPFVVSAVDPGGKKMTEFITGLTRQLQGKRLKRLVLVSRLGVGDSLAQAKKASGLMAQWSPTLNRADFEDIASAEAVLRVSKLPYLILRTTRLTDARLGAKVVTTEAKNPPPSRIGRADLANFIVEVLEQDGYDRQELTVGAERT
jgi:putative NADH-flavin reductase